MEQTIKPSVWGQPFKLSHWLKHAALPVALLLALLTLPHPWNPFERSAQSVIIVELEPPQVITRPDPKPVEPPPPAEPLPQPVSEPAPTAPPKTVPQPSVQEKPTEPAAQAQPVEPVATSPMTDQTETAKPTTGDILLMAKNRTSIEITEEFMPRSASAKNFHIPEQEIQNWLDDIPYLDESVDRPTIEMRFYAEGLEGQIEKFFDKITISKTFTTKYGTKIHCALIGVIAACSWK